MKRIFVGLLIVLAAGCSEKTEDKVRARSREIVTEALRAPATAVFGPADVR